MRLPAMTPSTTRMTSLKRTQLAFYGPEKSIRITGTSLTINYGLSLPAKYPIKTNVLFRRSGWVKWPGHKAAHERPSTREIKNEWSHVPTPHTFPQSMRGKLYLYCRLLDRQVYSVTKTNEPTGSATVNSDSTVQSCKLRRRRAPGRKTQEQTVRCTMESPTWAHVECAALRD